MSRRSYAHYCPVARSLDVVGERWTLLIVRELALGPRRYTDLHADLPGISTDMLAARLKDMETNGLVVRRRLSVPVWVYELTPRGHELVPVLAGLARWGSELLGDDADPTDARRGHWFAIPVATALRQAADDATGTVRVRVDDHGWCLRIGPDDVTFLEEDDAADVDALVRLDTATATGLARGDTLLDKAIANGDVRIEGTSALAAALAG
ncbi:winged helix-turn-helix transcriptional regulator [Haloechinothrix halophila]|uniref:winged helix-turn-helix transcriptional regulator n=1 Tax=Haloechinothrix halophila TaxID=1069073 RepID=UPI000409F985|nr:helix-turn-helix domain-containing protein [Haloechinothrix halophila]